MSVYDVYRTDIGLFTVITDDTIYNFFSSLATGNIKDNSGNITALGSQIISTGYLAGTYNSIIYSSDLDPTNMSANAYLNATDFFPQTTRSGYAVTGTFDNYMINCKTGSNVSFEYYMRYQTNPGDFAIARTTLYKDGSALGSYFPADTFRPIGRTGASTASSAFANAVEISLLIFNTSKTALLNARFIFRDHERGANKYCNWARTNITTAGDLYRIITWLGYQTPITVDSPDPYAQDPDGGSGTGGGTGSFDGTGDDIDIPGLPTLSATDTGFITLFNPSKGQLQSLANYMWSSGFDLDTFKKLFADPMDCILGLSIVPVAVPNGGSKAVSVGNISTGVSMTVAASQYVEVDCGTLNVNEYWGAYLDYDPYTKAEIYLPYIGTHPVAVDDIMGKAVRVVYHIDILSGACTAFVKCGGSVLYEFIGQCSSSIPITGNDWTNVINGVISIAGAIGSMVATGGASAPMAAGVIAATATNSMKPNVEKSGSMSGTGGMLAVQTPYLILTRPRQALPSGQNSFMGYPSFITESLGSLSGYTEIESVHLEGINATEQELSEIESLLKSGVIF